MARLFFALWPEEKTRRAIDDIVRQFHDQDCRIVRAANLHLTLEFLGEVSMQDQQALIESASRIKSDPFDLVLTQLGWWKRPGILWLGPKQIPAELTTLVTSIKTRCEAQGLKMDKRPYKPHVTLARKARQVRIPTDTLALAWKVDRFALMESVATDNGVSYQVIETWPLAG